MINVDTEAALVEVEIEGMFGDEEGDAAAVDFLHTSNPILGMVYATLDFDEPDYDFDIDEECTITYFAPYRVVDENVVIKNVKSFSEDTCITQYHRFNELPNRVQEELHAKAFDALLAKGATLITEK